VGLGKIKREYEKKNEYKWALAYNKIMKNEKEKGMWDELGCGLGLKE